MHFRQLTDAIHNRIACISTGSNGKRMLLVWYQLLAGLVHICASAVIGRFRCSVLEAPKCISPFSSSTYISSGSVYWQAMLVARVRVDFNFISLFLVVCNQLCWLLRPVHREFGSFVYLKNIYVLKFLRIILNNCIAGGAGINYLQFFNRFISPSQFMSVCGVVATLFFYKMRICWFYSI